MQYDETVILCVVLLNYGGDFFVALSIHVDWVNWGIDFVDLVPHSFVLQTLRSYQKTSVLGVEVRVILVAKKRVGV
jgi:hypothetical protein